MAQIGKFEITPNVGAAGTTQISAKLAIANTGRAAYIKYAKHYMTNETSKFATMTLNAAGKPAFMTLGETSKSVAYNITNSTFNVSATNASKFQLVKVSGKDLTLAVNSGYTVSALVGTFTGDPGNAAEFATQIKVGILQNSTSAEVSAVYKVQFWDGGSYTDAGTITLTQASADAGLIITANPSTVPNYANTAGYKDVVITSNFAFNIVENNGVDVSWLSLTDTTGTEITSGAIGDTTVRINVTAQAVAAAQRSTQINFKNPVSGAILLTLTITQVAGAARAISLSLSTLSFAQNEVNVVKNFNVVANDDWYSEESASA